MDKKNILPNQDQPVIRTTAGKLPSHLAELSEEALANLSVGTEASVHVWTTISVATAYDGDEV